MRVQNYPRNAQDHLNEATLTPHIKELSEEELRRIVLDAIQNANRKSSRVILDIPDSLSDAEAAKIYRKSGRQLWDYFVRYCGDPAATAHQSNGRHYADVAREQFRNRTLQKERMNAGWRYQFIAKDAASQSGRFQTISDVGTMEADFNATISYRETPGHLSLYVSVKNRSNTMGGQDWPKAIAALESVAATDKNRSGAYLCVFGIAMEKGKQSIKKNQRTKKAYSDNTEVWKSDFFWPFFTNLSYQQIVTAVLDVLIQSQKPELTDVPIPKELIESFGECCREKGLLDEQDRFSNPHKLVNLFCGVV